MHSNNHKDKIFISIASYRDPEIIPTILDCISKAQSKYRLHFGVCLQDDRIMLRKLKNIKKKYGIKIKTVFCHWRESQGACWARYVIQRKLYKNEKYYLQLDSHHRFIEQWDAVLIDMLEKLKTNHDKNIIGGYCPGYTKKNNCDPGALRISSFDTFGPDGDLIFRPHVVTQKLEEPVFPAKFLSGHFIFADGFFVKECMYDPNMYFRGEEITLSARAYTSGYKFYHPSFPIVWHYYIREEADKHWNNHTKHNGFVISYNKKELTAKKRLRILLGMEESNQFFGQYGLGKTKQLKDYEKYAGINFKQKKIHRYTANVRGDAPVGYEMSEEEAETMLINRLVKIKMPENIIFDTKTVKLIILCIYDRTGKLIYRDDLHPQSIDFFQKHKIWERVVGLEATPSRATLTPYFINGQFSKPINIDTVEYYDAK